MAGQGSKSVLTLDFSATGMFKNMKALEKMFYQGAKAQDANTAAINRANQAMAMNKAQMLKQIEVLTKRVGVLEENQKILGRQLFETTKHTQANDAANKNLNKTVQRQGKYIDQANKSLKRKDERITALTKRVDGASKVFGNFYGIIRSGMKTMLGIGFATAIYGTFRGFTGLIRQAREFEVAMTGVAKTTNLSNKALEELQGNVQQISVDYGNPREHVAEITRLGGQLGIRGINPLSLFTETVTELELATNLTSTAAATSLARVLKLTATSVEEGAKRLANAYVSLGNRFAAVETEIAQRTLDLSPVLGRFGYAPDTVAAFGTAAALSQVQSQSLATAMNKLLIGLDQVAGSFDKTNEGMRALIKVFPDMKPDEIRTAVMHRDEGFMVALIDRLREFDPLSQQSILQVLGLSDVRTQKALYAILPLIQETYNASVAARTGEQDIDIEVARRRESYYNRLDVSIQRMLNDLDGVGKGLLSWLTNLSEGLSYVLPAITGVIKGFINIVSWLSSKLAELGSWFTLSKEKHDNVGGLFGYWADTLNDLAEVAEAERRLAMIESGYKVFPDPVIPGKENERPKGLRDRLIEAADQDLEERRRAVRIKGGMGTVLLEQTGFPVLEDSPQVIASRAQHERLRHYQSIYNPNNPAVYTNYENTALLELGELVKKGELDPNLYQKILNERNSQNKKALDLTMKELHTDLWGQEAWIIQMLEDDGLLPGGFMTEMLKYSQDDKSRPALMRQVADWRNQPLSKVQDWEERSYLPKGTAEWFINQDPKREEKSVAQLQKDRIKAEEDAEKEAKKLEEERLKVIREERKNNWGYWLANREMMWLRDAYTLDERATEDAAQREAFQKQIEARGGFYTSMQAMNWRENRRVADERYEMEQEEAERLREARLEREKSILTDLKGSTDVVGEGFAQLAIGAIELSDFLVNVFTDVRDKLVRRFISDPLSEGLTNLVGDGLINFAGSFGTPAPRTAVGPISLPRTRLAEGGTVIAPGLALVGEQGPEILSLPMNAGVMPLGKMGAGDVNVVMNVNDTIDPGVLARIVDERTDEIIARAEESLLSKLRGNSQVAQALGR